MGLVDHPLVRPFNCTDAPGVRRLLQDLPLLYQDGARWLHRRLGEMCEGGASGTVATYGGIIVGVIIETPKTSRRSKLSTIYVRSGFRRCGVGRAMLTASLAELARRGTTDVHLTVATSVEHSLLPLLGGLHFNRVAIERNRYGKGRHEAIYLASALDLRMAQALGCSGRSFADDPVGDLGAIQNLVSTRYAWASLR